MKAISAIISIILILMIIVALASLSWMFSSSLFSSMTETGTSSIKQFTETLSSCIKIESVNEDKVYVRNCGQGLITNDSISIYVDDAKFNFQMIPTSIKSGELATITLSAWGLPNEKHNLKITNPYTSVVSYFPYSNILIFSDGFETGDFSRWNGVSGSPDVVSNTKKSGIYSMRSNQTNEYVTRYFEDTKDIYWSWWIRHDNLPDIDGEYVRYCGLEGSGGSSTRIVSVELYNQLNSLKIRLVEMYPINYDYKYSTPLTLNTNEWHNIITRFKKDVNGGYQVWFDGNQILSDMGRDTSSAGDADELRIGYGGDSGGPYTLYTDDVKIFKPS